MAHIEDKKEICASGPPRNFSLNKSACCLIRIGAYFPFKAIQLLKFVFIFHTCPNSKQFQVGFYSIRVILSLLLKSKSGPELVAYNLLLIPKLCTDQIKSREDHATEIKIFFTCELEGMIMSSKRTKGR